MTGGVVVDDEVGDVGGHGDVVEDEEGVGGDVGVGRPASGRGVPTSCWAGSGWGPGSRSARWGGPQR